MLPHQPLHHYVALGALLAVTHRSSGGAADCVYDYRHHPALATQLTMRGRRRDVVHMVVVVQLPCSNNRKACAAGEPPSSTYCANDLQWLKSRETTLTTSVTSDSLRFSVNKLLLT